MKKCKIIMNPQSGKKKKVNYHAMYDLLRKHGYDGEIIFTQGAKDATRIVEELPNDVIFYDYFYILFIISLPPL